MLTETSVDSRKMAEINAGPRTVLKINSISKHKYHTSGLKTPTVNIFNGKIIVLYREWIKNAAVGLYSVIVKQIRSLDGGIVKLSH